MKLIGLRVGAHDSNISYYDGETVRYYKSERRMQSKHHQINGVFDWRSHAQDVWGLDYNEIDEVATSFGSQYEFERHFGNPKDVEKLVRAVPNFPGPFKTFWLDHHYTHALSYTSNIKPDVTIVMDGLGDFESAWSVFKGDKLIERSNNHVHGSIGLLMNQAATYMNIQAGHVVDLAGKLMGLQSYGSLDQQYYNKLKDFGVSNSNELFSTGLWHQHKGDNLIGRHTALDWIRTVHEKTGFAILEFFQKYCKSDDVIFYTGGVAQNVLWNTLLKKHFKNLVIEPQSADEGISIGAVEWLRRKNKLPRLEYKNFPFSQSDQAPINIPTEETIEKVVRFLADGKIVAWYQGNGEIGPRALGNRSILMDPRLRDGRQMMNRIKCREHYRPFGASILSEFSNHYFDMPSDNPYMLYVGNAKDLNAFPAITHVDGTCRVQTVESNSGPFRTLLEKFHQLTGCPVLLNTSLNLGGYPIAGCLNNAEELFTFAPIDVLVVGNKITVK